MTILAFALILVAVAVMVAVHFRTQKKLAQAVLDRQVMLDKQAKVFVRQLARSHSAATKLIDQSRALHDDVRQLHQISEELHREMKNG